MALDGNEIHVELMEAHITKFTLGVVASWSAAHASAETLAVVGTYLHGHLLERLPDFQTRHPTIDLRVQTHNNKIDLATETVDAAIRFGEGARQRVQALPLQAAVRRLPGVAAWHLAAGCPGLTAGSRAAGAGPVQQPAARGPARGGTGERKTVRRPGRRCP